MNNSGQPAFSLNQKKISSEEDYKQGGHGLTKREYAAIKAMQGMVAFDLGQNHEVAKEIAKRAIIMADELLKQLEI